MSWRCVSRGIDRAGDFAGVQALAREPLGQRGGVFDDELKERVKTRIRVDLSGRHVPNDVFAIPEVPRTLNGKKLEVPIKRLLLGQELAKVVNRDSVINPGSLAWFVDFAAARAPT